MDEQTKSLVLLVYVNTGADVAWEDALTLAELIVANGWSRP